MDTASTTTQTEPTDVASDYEEAIGNARGQLRVGLSDGTATIEFTRPRKRNAISLEMWEAFGRIMPALAADERVNVVVLRGTPGGPFSAGADISEFTTLRADVDGARRYNRAVERGEQAIIDFPRPTIALVQGFAIGGGAQLALACDLRLCDGSARFAVTPAKLGLVYGLPSTRRLVESVGSTWARYILFTGEQLDAATAERIGLVHQVLDSEQLTPHVYQLAARMGSLARVSIEGSKALIAIATGGDTQGHDPEAIFEGSILSAEYAEGVRAFLDKRPPEFRRARLGTRPELPPPDCPAGGSATPAQFG